MNRMPALFIGHGSPMNTLETNPYTEAWGAIGRSVPVPKAILCVSAHWFIGSTAVTAMPMPRTIHDFYGFPQPLFDFQYPAPGAPDLAARVAEIAKPDWVGLDRDQWGLDHGTWSVLAHMFPEADIPVIQLSLNAMKPIDYHMKLGAALAPLRDEGVLIVGSGNVVHNLREINWHKPDHGEAWAVEVDEAVQQQMAEDPGQLDRVTRLANYRRAAPTPDHFLPLAYIAGLAAAGEGTATPLIPGYAMGSLSMTCYAVGGDHLI
ncbi:MAG: 4,5-DOPA dioxygenase extradiol [Hyphomonas sp.]